jgi:hypothetical protein
MAIVTALLGILAYLLRTKYPSAPWVLLVVLIVGLICFLLAFGLGASTPRSASIFYRLSILFPLGAGGLVAFGAIWLSAYLGVLKGGLPSPHVEAVTAAIVAVAALISDKLRAMEWFRPSNLARIGTSWHYESTFPSWPDGASSQFIKAYEAIHAPALSDSEGAIGGWGLSATVRRLKLINKGLEKTQPKI